jgi:transposase
VVCSGIRGGLFSYVSPESRVPPGHPLRKVRGLVRDVLAELSRSFARLYAREGRPSVPPEQLLSALLIQVLYGIRSERQLMEQLNYNLLYRWFVGLSPDDLVWDPTTFTKNRERLQTGEVFEKFITRLLNHPQVKPLLSDEHFSVDGTLIEAWASQRSFRPKDGSDEDGSNFHGQTRKNDTHQSTTDPDSRLYRKAAGREAKLSYMGHVTMENRHGLAVAGMLSKATGTAERRASEAMLAVRRKLAGRRITVGEDKADHAAKLRAVDVTPHVTQNHGLTKTGRRRRSAIDGRTNPTHGVCEIAITARDDRVHLRLGQAAWYPAKNQASRHSPRRRGLSAQPHCLQSGPHSETRLCIMAPPVGQLAMTYPAALKALSTGPDNRPFSPTQQHGNETHGFFSRLLENETAPCGFRVSGACALPQRSRPASGRLAPPPGQESLQRNRPAASSFPRRIWPQMSQFPAMPDAIAPLNSR